MAYRLGPVKPHVRAAANEVGRKFGVATIYGVASRAYASDHPLGLALDFMVGTNASRGQAIAAYVQTNAPRLGVTYVIWQQRIWSRDRSGEGWRPMEDRGSATANHMDHVHVSFSASGSGGSGLLDFATGLPGVPDVGTIAGAADPVSDLAGALRFFSDPAAWMRVAMFVAGLVLLLIALGALSKVGALRSHVLPQVRMTARGMPIRKV